MSEKGYAPPYTITDKTVNLISAITEIIAEIAVNDSMSINPRLLRANRILGAPDEICQVKNAYEAYNELLGEAGLFRSGGVGVFAGKQLVHMAPQAKQVPILIKDLVDWAKKAEVHPLIKSCVFHYEFEFIHPFADGNGRMGRMWQTLLLYNWKPLFGWLPIETLIRERQEDYYKVLGECDYSADSAKFIEFLLTAVYDALCEIAGTEQVRDNYLLPALKLGYIEMTIPEKPNSSKQKYRPSARRL